MRIDTAVPPVDRRIDGSRELAAGAAPAAPLSKDLFATVVANAPLISIDLLVEDANGSILLGLRTNPPAKGCWFAPGGRVRKNEPLDTAFSRIALEELGLHAERAAFPIAGVYEHFYDINFAGTENASTHYVVLAYRLPVDPASLRLPPDQHSQYQWMAPDQILLHPDVHPYTKAYFELT